MANTPHTSSPHGPGGHETSEVSPRGPFVFLFFLTLALAAIFAGLYGIEKFLENLRQETAQRQAAELTPGVVPQGHPIPPEPRLEATADADIAAVRKRDQAILGAYAWDNPSQSLARIPIDRAIDMVVAAGHGIPTTLPATGLVEPSTTQPIGGAP